MYYLRSRARKDDVQDLGYLDFTSDNMAQDKTMKIILTRLPILENHFNHDKTFFVKNDGKIEVKGEFGSGSNWNKIYVLIVIVLILAPTMFYFKGECLEFGRGVTKRTVIFHTKKLNPLVNNVNRFIMNAVDTVKNKWSGQIKLSPPPQAKKNCKRKKSKRKGDVCYNDFEDLVLNHMPGLRVAENYTAQKQLSFIEEQCMITRRKPKIADNFRITFNSTRERFDIDSLPNFASFSKGSRILSTLNTEHYVAYKVRAIFQYVFGVEYFDIDPFYICRLSSKLCDFFVTRPSSILEPWIKPEDCWSFKGSNGKLQIALSDKIYITAVSLEHIPSKLASLANTCSAPRVFSIIGIDDSEGYRFTSRIHLGTYEYLLMEPNIQTFSLSEECSSHPYKIIEFIVESNHGNKNCTCVYRLRVHGHTEKFS